MTSPNARKVLVGIPVVVFLLSVMLVNAAGPFYLGGNLDPEYEYLGNSLTALTFHVPPLIGHPGITLHVLGALVILGKWLLGIIFQRSWQPLETDVLSNPEAYLHVINLAIIILLCLSMYCAAREIYRSTGSLWAAVVLELSFFFFPATLLSLFRVSPEPLLAAFIFALMIPLTRLVFAPESATDSDILKAVKQAGLIFGAGVVTKIVLLPFATVLLLAKGYKQKLWFLLSPAGGFLVFFSPSLPRFLESLQWFTSLVTHTGVYGSGPVGLPATTALKDNLRAFCASAPLLPVLFVLYMAALIVVHVRTRQTGDRLGRNVTLVLLAGCLGIVIHAALTVQHFAAHYVVPSLVFTCFLNAVLVVQYRSFKSRWLDRKSVV